MKREKRRISLRRRICEGGNSSALYRSIGKPERGVWENARMKKERRWVKRTPLDVYNWGTSDNNIISVAV